MAAPKKPNGFQLQKVLPTYGICLNRVKRVGSSYVCLSVFGGDCGYAIERLEFAIQKRKFIAAMLTPLREVVADKRNGSHFAKSVVSAIVRVILGQIIFDGWGSSS